MSERTSYEPGTPSWVDLATPDPAAAKQFYGELFGWVAADAGPPEETGGYAMFTLRGKNVAGVAPLMNPDQPPMWSTYVSSDDADAVVARAKDAGGQAIVEPMDVMDVGRMAFLSVGDGGVATAMDMPPGAPDGVPAHWMGIFGSADTDATAAKAKELGG